MGERLKIFINFLFVVLVPIKYLFSLCAIVVELPQNETLIAVVVDIVFM